MGGQGRRAGVVVFGGQVDIPFARRVSSHRVCLSRVLRAPTGEGKEIAARWRRSSVLDGEIDVFGDHSRGHGDLGVVGHLVADSVVEKFPRLWRR